MTTSQSYLIRINARFRNSTDRRDLKVTDIRLLDERTIAATELDGTEWEIKIVDISEVRALTLPIGTKVRISIHSIGDRVEIVTGTVTGYNKRGNQNVVKTDSGHGEVVASSEELEVISADWSADGASCFALGLERIVPRAILVDHGVEAARSWYAGWDAANLAAPVDEQCIHCAENVYVEQNVGLVSRTEGGTYDFCEVSSNHKHEI